MRPLLLIVHVLLLVSWLGVDVGVFYGSFVVIRPGLRPETRREIRRMMRLLDLGPRLSLVLSIPVGASLAYSLGTGLRLVPPAVAVAGLALVWVGTLAWVLAIVREYRAQSGAGGAGFRNWYVPLDWTVRVAVAAFALLSGAASLVGAGIWTNRAVAIKVMLFGVIVVAGLSIRLFVRGYAPLLVALTTEGETPDRIAAIRRAMRPVRAAVLTVWACLLAIVAVSFLNFA